MAKPDHNTPWAGKRIGLFGGSFNPAHAAHLEITLSALEKLHLDGVWWLVSPQNPLKSTDDMASFNDRMRSAQSIATDKRIYVTDIEKKYHTHYTVDSLDRILEDFPDTQFVWLMGADNLAQFSQWKDWKKIARTVTFAIFDRPSYSSAVEVSDMATYFRDNQISEDKITELIAMPPPAWIFIRDIQNPLSSTKIRRKTL